MFTDPFQAYSVDIPVCNNWADIGLPEVYNDPDLASFNGATTQTSPTDDTHFVKQAVGVFATDDAAAAAFHRVVDRTVGCSGQTATMRIDSTFSGTVQVWSFFGGPPGPADAGWTKQEAGTDRRCFTQTRLRENVLLQAKVCQSGNGGPAVNVLAGAMQNTLGSVTQVVTCARFGYTSGVVQPIMAGICRSCRQGWTHDVRRHVGA